MSFKEQLLRSFIKGLGQTTATLTVLGLAGVSWYLYNNKVNEYTQTKESSNKDESTIVLEEVENVNNTVVENDTQTDIKTDVDFRKIFDKM